MITIGACYLVSSKYYDSDDTAYYPSASAIMKLFSYDWNLPTKPAILIEGILQRMLVNVLGRRLPPSGCTVNYSVLVFFYEYTIAFTYQNNPLISLVASLSRFTSRNL